MLPLSAVGAGFCLFAFRHDRGAISMHKDDWLDGAGRTTPRRFRTPAQFLHHMAELTGNAVPLARLYLLRSIPPALREQVMVVTAEVNACPA